MNPATIHALEEALNQAVSSGGGPQQRADLLVQLAMELRASEQWDRMLELCREAHELSEQSGYTVGIARATVVRGFVEYIRADYTSAVQHSVEALSLAPQDDYTDAFARANLALAQWSLGNFEEAIRHGTYALEAFRRRGDLVNVAFAHGARGGIQHSLGHYDEAIEAHREALALFRELKHKIGESRALAGLASTLLAQGNTEEALVVAQCSLRLAREHGNGLGISRALNDLGEVHAMRGEYSQALAFHQEALALRRRESYRQAETTSLLNIGRVQAALGNHEEAIATLIKGLEIARQIGALPKVRDLHQALMAEYEATGQFAEALREAKAYIEVRSKITSEQVSARQQAIELEAKLLWAQKDAEVQRLRSVDLKRMLDELRVTQAELVNSEKLAALGSLVAALAHEINTPLGVIRSTCDITTRCAERLAATHEGGVADVLRSNAVLTAQAAERIAGVIRRLKSFAGIDRAPYSRISIAELIENTVLLLEPEYRGRVEVRRQYDDMPQLHCYGADLGQVLVNLLRNAVEAIDGPGIVSIHLDMDEQWVRVQVIDTGRGIPEDLLPHIFDAGFNSRETRIKASLSLFASASIVRRHGGELRAESRLGEGATFTILLPRSLEYAEQGPSAGVSSKAG